MSNTFLFSSYVFVFELVESRKNRKNKTSNRANINKIRAMGYGPVNVVTGSRRDFPSSSSSTFFLLILKLVVGSVAAVAAKRYNCISRSFVYFETSLSIEKHTHTRVEWEKSVRIAKQREIEKKQQPRNIKTSGKQRNDFTDTTYKHTHSPLVSFLFCLCTQPQQKGIRFL